MNHKAMHLASLKQSILHWRNPRWNVRFRDEGDKSRSGYRTKPRGEPKPAPHALHSIKSFADQDIHRNAAVLCFAGGGVIAGQRVRFGHASRG